MSRVLPVLRSLKFAVGYQCNRDCGFCLQQDSDRAPILDFALVRKIFGEEMIRRDLKLVTLTGGEPTYGPYRQLSLEIIKFVHGLGKEISIFTNGDLLDDETLSDFHSAGLDRFRISLYDPIDWQKTRELIVKLRAFNWPAMFKYTVTKENFHLLSEVLIGIPKVGIDWFQIKPYNRVEVPTTDQRYELEPNQVLHMAKLMIQFRRQFPDVKIDLLPLCYEFLTEDIPLDSLSPCNCGKGPQGYLVIGPTGEVRICGAYPDPIGNAYSDSITDLWENHPLLWQVRGLAERPRPAECQGCEHWKKCARTDCHSATYAKYRGFDHGNPQCPLLAAKK